MLLNKRIRMIWRLMNAVISAPVQTYSGSGLTPTPTVTINGVTIPSSNYNVTYSNNINAGIGNITISGKKQYIGNTTGTFTINKATPTYTAPTAKTNLKYNGSNQALLNAGSTSHGTFQYALGSVGTDTTTNYSYTGAKQTVTLDAGTYKLQCWGASGGQGPTGGGEAATYNGYGLGGYSEGTLTLSTSTTVYIYVGGQGASVTGKQATGFAGGFNGGGNGGGLGSTSSATNGSGGGGASDIRIGQDSLYARVIVAGGGGGASWLNNASSARYGGAGGGTSGASASAGSTGSTIPATGGTQTSGGTGGIYSSNTRGENGSFGQGGNGVANTSAIINSGAGGGGGWYGGGAGGCVNSGNQAHGAGGSGYVYTSSTVSNYPSGCLLNSNYYLTDAQTIAGNASMPSTSGSTETGHDGNGYVKITNIAPIGVPTTGWTTAVTTQNAPNTYYMYWKLVGDSNHTDVTASSPIPVTIAKGTGSATVTGRSVSYNGGAQNLVTTTGATGTVYYRLGTSGSWTTTKPKSTNAGTYTVYYYVAETTNYTAYGSSSSPKSVTATISKITPVLSTSPSLRTGLSYTGSAQNLLSGGAMKHSSSNSTSVSGTFTYTQQTNAGTYSNPTWTFTPSNTTNYNSTSGTITGSVTIAKVNPTYTAPTAKSGLFYTGSAQALLNAGSTSHGTIYYSTNGSSWSTTIPTGTTANTYTIYWKLTGDTNHNDVSQTILYPYIQKADRILSFGSPEYTLEFEDTLTITATPSAGSGDGTITYSIENTTYATINSSTGAVTTKKVNGDVTVTATISAGSNYNSATTSYTLHVFQKYINRYLTIVSESNNNTIKWHTYNNSYTHTISVSTDNGTTWTNYTSNTNSVTLATLNTGDIILIKGSNSAYFSEGGSWNSPYASNFQSTGNFRIEGNIMSLVYADNFKNQKTLEAANTFRYLFYQCSKLTTAENLILPATTLSNNCYDRMLSDCTILTTAPTLPAQTLVSGCYSYMFNGSRALNNIRCFAVNHSASNCTNNWVQNVASSGTFTKHPNASWNTGDSAIPRNWVQQSLELSFEKSEYIVEPNSVINVSATTNDSFYDNYIIYSVSNTSYATISSSGLVSSKSTETTITITASLSSEADMEISSATCSLIIANKISLSGATVTIPNSSYTYTGSTITPTPTVTVGGSTVDSTNYTITYSNNLNVGTATITITGEHLYKDIVTKTFTITKANPTYTAPTAKTGLYYNGEAQALLNAGSTSHGTIYYMVESANNLTITKVSSPSSIADGAAGNITFTTNAPATITLVTTSGSGWSAQVTSSANSTSHTVQVTNLSVVLSAGSIAANAITVTAVPTDTSSYNPITTATGINNVIILSAVQTVTTYSYTGDVQTATLDAGTYKLQCWGASGGEGTSNDSTVTTNLRGKGGYSEGILTLTSSITVYIYVGGQGTNSSGTNSARSGGFNGGGKCQSSGHTGSGGGSGGGASDIRIGQDSLYARVIVAGGGGGAGYNTAGGSGGGETGNAGIGTSTADAYASGGTQTSGGTCTGSYGGTNGSSGSFGSGGSGGYSSGKAIGGGGGAGWYGGAGGKSGSTNVCKPGGGGSGFVYTSSTVSNYPSGCLLNSNYYLTSAQTIAGNASMPSTSGSTETGHTGNGYVKITKID